MNWGWSPSSGRSSGASPDGLYEHSSGRIRFWRIHADYSLKEIRKRGEVSMSISHKLNSRAKLLGSTAAAFMLLGAAPAFAQASRSEEHTSELQSLMRISYAVFCLQKKTLYSSLI